MRKNKKFIDPRYFMDEKMELNEAADHPYWSGDGRLLRVTAQEGIPSSGQPNEPFMKINTTFIAKHTGKGPDPNALQVFIVPDDIFLLGRKHGGSALGPSWFFENAAGHLRTGEAYYVDADGLNDETVSAAH
jgi:hypothetical protein